MLKTLALLTVLILAGCDRRDPNLMVDPVCGMEIDPATAAATSVHAGKTYYFCDKNEKERFDKDPEKYLKKG